jgi:uncharacterized protein YegL
MDLDLGNVIQNRRLPIYLLVDTSDSMSGEPIQIANWIISSLHRELMNVPEIIEMVSLSVITFGGPAQQIVALTELIEFVLPELSTGGPSKLGAAFRALKDALGREIRPNQPGQKGDYKALIFLLVGSKPTDNWQSAANALHLNQYINSFIVLACNENINVDYLKQITTNVFTAKAFVPKQAVRQFIRFASASLPPFMPKRSQTYHTINRSQMKEVSASMTVAPFGKVNYWDLPNGEGRMVRVTILTDFVKERAKFGIAIDGSRSMHPFFETNHLHEKWLGKDATSNYITTVVQKLGTFLAHRDWDGTVSLIYWATGTGHEGIQDLGDFSEEFVFSPPRRYGDKTCLLPALKYFTDGIQRPDLYNAEWGIFVFLTDGAIEDLVAVREYSIQLAKDLSEGKRLGKVKLLLLGLSDRVNKAQFDALDDLETETEIDLWDAKLLTEIKTLDDPDELFAELADPTDILALGDGIVRDNSGNVVADFRDGGLPAVLQFMLPYGEPAFSLEVAGKSVHQPLPFAAFGLDHSSLLSVYPLDINFGFVSNLDQQPAQTIYVRNSGVGIWKGSVEADVAWLNVKPVQFECPPISTLEIRISLKPGAGSHLGLQLNQGIITITGAGYQQTVRATVFLQARHHIFSTAEERVIETWDLVHGDLESFTPKSFQETTKGLVRHFCDQLGLSLLDGPKLSGEFCRFVLDVSTAFVDTGLAAKSPLVCFLCSELSENDLFELDTLIREFDLPGRLVMFLTLFGEQEAIQAAHRLVMASRFPRTYDIILLGRSELRYLVYAQNPHEALRTMVLSHIDLEAMSPFQTAAPASDNTFSGREFELGTITGNVREKSYAIVGGRRIGKTSLLQRLHRENLPRSGFRTLFYDCGLSAYQDFLDSTPVAWSPEAPAHAPRTFHELFNSHPADKPVVLLLDETDGLIVGDVAANWPVFKMLRALVNSGRMQIVMCGADNLRQALKDPNSPLLNLAQDILRLGRLDYLATKQLVTRPMRQLQISLSSEKTIIDLIWEHTSGHPCVVQRLCAKLLKRINEKSVGDTTATQRHITPDDVKAIVQDPVFLSEDFINVYLEKATYLERIIVLALAYAEDRPRRVRDIRALLQERVKLDLKLRYIESALERLVELRCILQKSSQGYTFDVEAFPRVLQVPNVATEDLLEHYVEDYQDYGDVQLQSKYQEPEYRR